MFLKFLYPIFCDLLPKDILGLFVIRNQSGVTDATDDKSPEEDCVFFWVTHYGPYPELR